MMHEFIHPQGRYFDHLGEVAQHEELCTWKGDDGAELRQIKSDFNAITKCASS